jgi:hypothetical protein
MRPQSWGVNAVAIEGERGVMISDLVCFLQIGYNQGWRIVERKERPPRYPFLTAQACLAFPRDLHCDHCRFGERTRRQEARRLDGPKDKYIHADAPQMNVGAISLVVWHDVPHVGPFGFG